MEAGTLVEWVKHPGDVVKRGDIIAVVDTQKGAPLHDDRPDRRAGVATCRK